MFVEESAVGPTPTLRCMEKSAEVLDEKGLGSAPLGPKSAEVVQNKVVSG
jgi:hypothetical protein